jgi:hypothetical protein
MASDSLLKSRLPGTAGTRRIENQSSQVSDCRRETRPIRRRRINAQNGQRSNKAREQTGQFTSRRSALKKC